MRKRKHLLLTASLIAITAILTTYLCDRKITDSATGRLYSDSKEIPYNRVGLLLGTSKTLPDGRNNLYYTYRIQATIRLLRDKKIKYLVISGDNSRKDYNEPESMRSDLISAGADSSIIYLDYAGFRTFDSIKRLKEIFGQDSVTVISQKFHNERAIYIASNEGMSAVGYNALDVTASQGIKTRLREKLARVKVFTDLILGIEPHFLGSTIRVPE